MDGERVLLRSSFIVVLRRRRLAEFGESNFGRNRAIDTLAHFEHCVLWIREVAEKQVFLSLSRQHHCMASYGKEIKGTRVSVQLPPLLTLLAYCCFSLWFAMICCDQLNLLCARGEIIWHGCEWQAEPDTQTHRHSSFNG